MVARRNPQKIEFRFVRWPKMITLLCKSSTEKLPLNGDTSAFRQRIIIRNKAMSIYHKIPENSSLDVLKWNACFEGFLLENYWKYCSPLYCLETSAVETCVPFIRLDKGSSTFYSELRRGRNETYLRWNTFFILLTFPF